MVVIPTEESTISQLEKYLSIIKDEMNIKDVEFSGNYQDLLEIELKLNFAVVGPKLGKSVGEVKNKVEKLDDTDKKLFIEEKVIQLPLNSGENVTLTMDDVLIDKKGKGGFELLEGSNFLTLLDTKLTEELKEVGLVREFVRAVQTFRKELDLPVDLRVDLYVQTDSWLQTVSIKFDELVPKNLIINSVKVLK